MNSSSSVLIPVNNGHDVSVPTDHRTLHELFLMWERQAADRTQSPYSGLWQQFHADSGRLSFRLSYSLKRFLDVLLGCLLVLFFSPVLLLLTASVILSSPGPILYKSLRIGRFGKPFYMLKFRTMVANADQLRANLRDETQQHNELFKLKADPRVTPLGQLLRKYSLDELPQLFNVIRGDMSLVGPRPFAPDDARLFEEPYTLRFEAIPGMTGLWQVSGRSELSFQALCELDLSYTMGWTLLRDFKILLKTVPVVFGKVGAF